MAMDIDDIFLEEGSDGRLTSLGDTSNGKFDAHDAVNGTGIWELFGDSRVRETHAGKIIISFSTELVEPATVKGIGVSFEQITPADRLEYGESYRNGGCARGVSPFLAPSNTGEVTMNRKINLRYKEEREPWNLHWFEGDETMYFNLASANDLIGANCGSLALNNVLGSSDSYDFHVDRNKSFPRGETQIHGEVELSWNIDAFGRGSGAGAHYGLEASPYIVFESCSTSKVLPEQLTIRRGSDY